MREEIEKIIYNKDWAEKIAQIEPIVYYRNDEPYGFIKLINFRSGVIVLSASKDNREFLREMISFIRRVANDCRVYIVHNNGRDYISDNIIHAFRNRFRCKKLVVEDKFVITICERRR